MKYCTDCGFRNEDAADVCASCGYSLTNATGTPATDTGVQQPYISQQSPPYPAYPGQQPYSAQQMPYQAYPGQQPPPYPTYPAQQQGPVLSGHPVINLIKTLGSSTLFLVTAVLSTVILLFNIISILTPVDMSSLLDEEIFSNFDFGISVSDLVYTMNTVANMTRIITMVPAILVCIGLWMFYTACRNASDQPVSTGGLTMIKVVMILNLCGMLAIPLIVFIGVLMSPAASVLAPMIIVLIIVCVVMILPVLYYVFIISTINTVKKSVTTGMPLMRVSGFVAVCNIIMAFFSLFSAFSGSTVTLLFSLCNVAILVLTAVMIFSYKSKMQMLIAMSNPPAMY